MTHAETTAERILEYLRTHPNQTQVQLQIALDFDFETWQNARVHLRNKIGALKQNGKTVYFVLEVINGRNK